MSDETARLLPLEQCTVGTVYRVYSRNLLVAVYAGNGGFVGIREKFGDRYLFTEYHWDCGPPYGTLRPLEVLGEVPDDVVLRERDTTRCSGCSQPVTFDGPARDGGLGWVHTDGSALCADAFATSRTYRPLFDLLDRYESELGDAR